MVCSGHAPADRIRRLHLNHRLHLGIIGCGDIAQFTALFARLNRRIQITACCDTDLERTRKFAKRYNIARTYINYQEMLISEDLDTVYLAVHHYLHYPMMQDLISAGIPIFVEKPITRTLDEGLEIVRLATEKDLRIGVNYQYRYDTGCFSLARAVQNGVLGKINYIRCNIPWHREKDYFENAGWHRELATSGGGTLLTQGSHILDIALWSSGTYTGRVTGNLANVKFTDIEVEDLALGTIELDNGVLLQITSSMVSYPEQAVSIEIYGDKGTAIYTNKPFPRVNFRGVHAKRERTPVWGVHALQRSLEGFRRWIVDDMPYLTPGPEALPVLAVVDGIYRSAKSGHTEQINLLNN